LKVLPREEMEYSDDDHLRWKRQRSQNRRISIVHRLFRTFPIASTSQSSIPWILA
jgi:hypothetical protein